MEITKEVFNDKIEIVRMAEGYPVVQVRTVTVVKEGEQVISSGITNRRVVYPNANLSNEDSDVAEIAKAVFTDEAKAAYESHVAEQDKL